MELQLKPDIETTFKRMEAFWCGDVLDRPVVQFSLVKPVEEHVPLPESSHALPADRWMDAQYQAEYALASLSNQDFLGDSLPVAFPNLGPEVFSGFYGCQLHFGDYGTSWSDPILHDWSQASRLRLDWNSPYLHKLDEMTEALLAVGRGKFITGMTDWHPGGDCLAAFRDPQNLAMDLLENPEAVKTLLAQVEQDYYAVYDRFYQMLRAAGQPITTWLTLADPGKYYVPSNDFSIMVSKRMFEEFFLEGIRRECQFLDRSIYHLDGPGALRHLDALLTIPELNAIQFVPGSGNEGFANWVGVYQKIQAAGKGIEVFCGIEDIDLVMQTLSPRGLFLLVDGVPDREAAANLLEALARWTRLTAK